MKRQHQVPSPDKADALALTFAYPVMPKIHGAAGGAHRTGDSGSPYKATTEYDHLAR